MSARAGLEPKRDRGSLAIAMMFLVIITLVGGGMLVDGGRVLAARQHAFNIAQGAARSAAALGAPMAPVDAVTARRAAMSYAQRAGIAVSDVSVSTVRGVVTVTVVERRSAVFTALVGKATFTVRAVGVAELVWRP